MTTAEMKDEAYQLLLNHYGYKNTQIIIESFKSEPIPNIEDYTEWRKENLPEASVDDLLAGARSSGL